MCRVINVNFYLLRMMTTYNVKKSFSLNILIENIRDPQVVAAAATLLLAIAWRNIGNKVRRMCLIL